MKNILLFTVLFSLFSFQKNAIVETKFIVYGNCEMCKSTIEKAGNLKKIAVVDWDKNTKIATITYDTSKTNLDEVVKRISLSGYDSENFRAPENAYKNLHGCCQYERPSN